MGFQADNFNAYAIFSNAKEHISSQKVMGGFVIALFGNVDLDLTKAEVVGDVRPAAITILAIFGNVSVTLPANWNVENRISGIFGDTEIKKMRSPRSSVPDVHLFGSSVFGNTKIKGR